MCCVNVGCIPRSLEKGVVVALLSVDSVLIQLKAKLGLGWLAWVVRKVRRHQRGASVSEVRAVCGESTIVQVGPLAVVERGGVGVAGLLVAVRVVFCLTPSSSPTTRPPSNPS